MRDGRAHVCVATDVAARGIDLPNLDLVIHADLPTNPAILLHRSGRTGRAGRKGICVLIVPLHRRSAAARVLQLANLDATTRAAPSIGEIETHYRQQILETATAALPPDEAEQPFVAELLAKLTPEQIAAAYLRQQLAARPVPEEISDTPIPAYGDKPRRERRTDGAPREFDGPREPRAPKMVGGVWFSLSLGRKHRADPKWLLPMICKAGGVTKRDVGSIKIDDTETRFEIAADKAQAFAEQLARDGSGEKGVTIAPAGAAPAYRPKPSHKGDGAPRPPYKAAPTEAPRKESSYKEAPRKEAPRKEAPRQEAPRYEAPRKEKPRSEAPRKEPGGWRPDAPVAAAKPKLNPKDKGKPKYKAKRTEQSPGSAPYKKPHKDGRAPSK